ncbi:MAG: hypothetical protein ABIE74_06785 [Pseudomonadota bacterium]
MDTFRFKDGRCYHIPVKRGEISGNIISSGSPERVEKIAESLNKPKEIANNRGFICINGTYRGIPVTAFNTGMGPASTAIILPEILDSVKADNINLVRIGTCGSLQPFVKPKHLVVANGAVRDEGTTTKWIFKEYPAIADMKISLAIISAALKRGFTMEKDLWHGHIHIKDELYAVENPDGFPMEDVRRETLEAYKKMGVLSTEMEFSVFAILADMLNHEAMMKKQKRRIQAGCIDLVVSPHDNKKTTKFEKVDQSDLIKVGLEALYTINQWNQGEDLTDFETLLASI